MVRDGKAFLAVPDDRVTVVHASEADRPALRRLMQLYLYDFSEFDDIKLNADGTFGDPGFIEEQFAPNHTTYVIRVDGELAGFEIVGPGPESSGDAGVTEMVQFFVMRAHRRRRIGRRAATSLFTAYSGPWEVRVIRENTGALAFWRDAIDCQTKGAFEESPYDLGSDRGTLFTFTSAGT